MLGAGAAALVVGWQWFAVRPVDLEFRPIDGAPGWQFATAGEVSGLSATDLLTFGLEPGPEPLPAARLEEVVHRDFSDGTPVAVFSDFFCPYCRDLIARLQRLASGGLPISISWHELPLLGPNSELAARAAEAAALQGGYAEFHAQLLAEGFRPLPAWMGEVAMRAGLDGAGARDGRGSRRAWPTARAPRRVLVSSPLRGWWSAARSFWARWIATGCRGCWAPEPNVSR